MASACPGTVRVLDGEVLRNRGYLYLDAALAEEAGVYIEYIPGREGMTMSPRFRGSTGREVLIVVDGVPYNQLPTGWAYLKSIPLEAVARVEVIQGPASWRWGDRALAGVINVVTMQGPREAARSLVSASDGVFNSERYRCNFGMTPRGVDVFASGNRILDYEPLNSYHNPGNARESSANVDGRVGYRWGGDAELSIVAGHFGGYERIVPFRAVVVPEKYLFKQESSDDRIRLYGRKRWGALEGRATGYRHTGRIWPEGEAGAKGEENAGTASLTWHHGEGSGLTLEVGGGNRLDPNTDEAVALASGRLLEELKPAFPIYLAAGGGYDMYAPGEGAFSPRAALAWFPKPSLKVYGAYNGGVRLPAPAELGRDERVGKEMGYEGGFRFYAPGDVEVGAAYFGNRGEDLYLDAEDAWVEELNRKGVEASAAGTLPLAVEWEGSYCRTDATTDAGLTALYVPRDRATARIGRLFRYFKGDLQIRTDVLGEYVGARTYWGGRYATTWPAVPPEIKELPAYWLMGVHFSLAIVSFQGYVNVENINRAPDYAVRAGYSLPRKVRTFVGFNWTFYD
jgi:outer membrane receptor protein involved in Fe transport